MLKKRAKASHALESRRLMCTELDIGSEGCSVRPRSRQFGKDRVLQNAAERRIVNPQLFPILDVPKLFELIHKMTDAAAG